MRPEEVAEENIVTAIETGTVTSATPTPKVVVVVAAAAVAEVEATDGATVKNEAPVANGPIGTNRKASPAAALEVNSSRRRLSCQRRLRRRHSSSNSRSMRIAGLIRWRTARRRTTGS